MGVYIYRVTAKLVKLSDGRKAHVAKFAYKPYTGWDEKVNARMHFRSGCVASENLKLKSDLIVTLDPTEDTEGTLYHNKGGLTVFVDDYTFGTDLMPRLGSVRKVGNNIVIEGT